MTTFSSRWDEIFPYPNEVVFTTNRSVYLSWKRRKNIYHIRLHRCIEQAGTHLLSELKNYILRGNRKSKQRLREYVNSFHIRHRTEQKNSSADGTNYDLQQLFDQLNQQYFKNSLYCTIGWGKKPSCRYLQRATARKMLRSIQLGSYDLHANHIRIHPRLDTSLVPKYYISWVIFHEMVHCAIPPVKRNGKMLYHSSKFHEIESLFELKESSLQWQEKNLALLLKR